MRSAVVAAVMVLTLMSVASCSPGDVTQVQIGGGGVSVRTKIPAKFATCAEAREHYSARIGGELQKPIPYKLYRIIPPNSAVTLDFNPERLNIYVDDNDVITKVTCG